MQNQTLRILKVEPGKPPYVKEIQNDLDDIQAEVGGSFEVVDLPDGTLLCCNEEGKLNDMVPNRRVGDDIICGPFFLVSDNSEGDFASLSDDQITELTKRFAEPEQFTGREPELHPGVKIITFC